ncbi:MAG: Mut7-C RNAse domain-containing protein [Candidatus Omnitrophica bacterium]|nr:Mut7-C RNAse domain-containing protein [Candidatus Omnitrophota bacterium]
MEKFIADGMLGKAGRWLRLMGYDTLYFNTNRKAELLRVGRKEGRIILTRDRKLALSNPDVVVLIESEGTLNQLKEVISKVPLIPLKENLFNRCSLCNSVLESKRKEEIKELVPEYVYSTKDVFSQCPSCKRVYWDGDHCKEIKRTIEKLLSSL